MTLDIKIRVLVNLFRDFRLRHILRVNYPEMAGDGPGQPAYDIFSIEPAFLEIYVSIS